MFALTRGRVIAWIFVCCSSFRCVHGAVFEPSIVSTSPEVNSTKDIENEVSENRTLDRQNSVTFVDKEAAVTTPKFAEGASVLGNTVPAEMAENPTVAEYKLPDKWTKFCHIVKDEYYESIFTPKTELISIICRVSNEYSDIWSMADLRMDLARYKDTNLTFSVDVNCDFKSSISLSWPFKINNLFKLIVQDCIVTDFLAEHKHMDQQTTLSDSLRVIELRDNEILISIDHFIEMTQNIDKIHKDFDCGHEETIEELTIRNITYGFLQGIEVVLTKLTELGEQFVRKTAQIPHKCIYKHMLNLDEGQSSSRSIYHMDLLTNNAVYSELRTFNMSYNHLKVLNDNHLHWSVRFPKLEMFDLSYNDISKLYRFEVPLHTSLEVVTTINLQNNRISTIDVEDLERFKLMPMVFIDLRNNGLNCDCSDKMQKLINYVSADKHLGISNISDYSYIGNLTCTNPEQLFGKTLKAINADMICEPIVHKEYFLVPILCLSASVVLLAVLLFIALRYRQEITILLFTRFNIIIPCQTREKYDNNKEYDAFVSYSSNEEEEVESIFENLENRVDGMSRPDFKFCMHHRDFVAGKTIFDNVTRAVENSRHTIILLSNHFLKSEFCLYEFQEAFRQSIMEKRRHLVIVMMEDIPEDRLPRDLRRCVKTFTYIKRDDYLFTERLVYALSVKQKNKVVKASKNVSNNVDHTNKVSSSTESSQTTISPNREISKDNCNTDNKMNPSSKFNKLNTYSENDAIRIDMTPNADELEETITFGEIDQPRMYRKLSKNGNGKLDLNIKQISDTNLSPVERKILQKVSEYDRSLSLISQDTGYGSDLTSLGDRPSPEVDEDFDRFLHSGVTC